MYGSRKLTLNSDDDSDFGSRYKTKPSSSSYGLSSARGSSSRDIDRDSRDTRDTFNTSLSRSSRDRDSFTRGPLDRDPRDNFTRDTRDTRDSFVRDSRDNFRDHDNYSRDGRDNLSKDRDRDRYDKSDKYSSYRNNKDNSDSSDDEPKSRYGASSRRVVRNSSDSDDSDKNDRRRMGSTKSRDPLGSSRLGSSRGGRGDSMGMGDIDSYDGANQKLKMMIQWDKSLCEQLDDIHESKSAKEKKIEQLKDDIHKDTIKEDGLKKKLSELRMNRKMLQARLDDFK